MTTTNSTTHKVMTVTEALSQNIWVPAALRNAADTVFVGVDTEAALVLTWAADRQAAENLMLACF